MEDKKDKKQDEYDIDLVNNESSKRAVWTFFIIVAIIGLAYWGWTYVSADMQSSTPSQEQTDPVAVYDSYNSKIDQILSSIPNKTDHAENMKVIAELLEVQKQVTAHEQSFKLPDGSYHNYEEIQQRISGELMTFKNKVVFDDESLYNYADLNLETADRYSVEKCLGVMSELLDNLKADEKVTNVFQSEEAQKEFNKKAQDRYDSYVKRAKELDIPIPQLKN